MGAKKKGGKKGKGKKGKKEEVKQEETGMLITWIVYVHAYHSCLRVFAGYCPCHYGGHCPSAITAAVYLSIPIHTSCSNSKSFSLASHVLLYSCSSMRIAQDTTHPGPNFTISSTPQHRECVSVKKGGVAD